MGLHPDFHDLLAEFVRSAVRFVLLGGYAVAVHARPRATMNLDLLVSGEQGNLEKMAAALSAFGAPAGVVAPAREMTPTQILYLGVPPVRIDLLRQADGVDTEQAMERAFLVQLGELTVPVIALEDLIANKRGSGRPQDLADVVRLERAVRRGR
jgi:predicted nucleotidyltransferase